METIGNDVTLSCVAIGNPLPHIYWFSGDTQELISPETQFNDRYKVGSKQHLLILHNTNLYSTACCILI